MREIMSNKLVGNGNSGKIVNPFARPVLTLTMNDQAQTELKAPDMPPDQVIKVLMTVAIDVMFQYLNVVTTQRKPDDKQPESSIIQ